MPKTVNEIKETLDIEATRAVESGLITDRQSMKKWLLDLGLEVTRETKKSLSIKNPNDDEKARPIRLTGAIYEQDFRLTETSQQLTIAASERYRREAEQRNQSDIQRYAEYSAKRSTELEQQYRQHQNGYTAETERSNERDIAADRPDYSSNQEAAATRHDSPIARTTTADQTATSELAAVERLEPRNSPSSQIKENPYYIEYSLDFTGMYNAYQQYLSGIRQQEQIQRYTSDAEQSRLSEKSGGEHDNNNVRRETVRRVRPEISRHELRTGQWNKTPSNSERDTLNELRSTIIEDYRRSTASVEATTASTRRSSTAYTSTVSDHQRIETIHANFKQHAQRSSEDSAEISEVRARTVRANYLSNFFTRCTTELESTVADTFKRFSAELADRQSSQKSGIEDYSASSRIGDQQSIETTSRTNHRENEFSRAVSAEISSINPTSVIKALDVLDQRKELQREQERQRSRDYDSPSPF